MANSWLKCRWLLSCALAWLVCQGAGAIVPSDATLLQTQRIWNAAQYNSFTDLEFFNGQFYATFREGTVHGVPPVGSQGGKLRVLRSSNGTDWSSVALMDFGLNLDLRDPKLSITPDNRLMLIGSSQPHNGSARQSYSWFSSNGTAWGSAFASLGSPQWLWRTVWSKGVGYGMSYSSNSVRLSTTTNGVSYSTLVSTWASGNEATMLVRPNGTAVAIIRRDGTGLTNLVGTSSGNFSSWNFVNGARFVGGPEIIELPDGRIVLGGRLTDGSLRTSLMFVNTTTGALDEFLTLPSGGDTSYPGFEWYDNKLWISYYSSHEGKSSIYLSQVSFANVPEPGSAIAVLLTTYFCFGRSVRRVRSSI